MSKPSFQVSEVNPLPEAIYEVEVFGESKTVHKVSLSEDYCQILTDGKVSPKELIEKSFEFLLEREPNTSILSKFHLQDIKKYFPEYEEEIQKVLK